ncbi:hypothetical protein RRG08_002607 [Elysia crispata]|uniref:Uncharacterized protein n=1 Tax=Elysia crispata TaxID=231223 RepID=A0AAE0Y5Q0_9GAST|nr:hypothetical protein RRG08_002607 [Elysia crispata]
MRPIVSRPLQSYICQYGNLVNSTRQQMRQVTCRFITCPLSRDPEHCRSAPHPDGTFSGRIIGRAKTRSMLSFLLETVVTKQPKTETDRG